MRRSVLLILWMTLQALQLCGQDLSLFDVDTAAYPLVKAKFYAMKGNEQVITLTPQDVVVQENKVLQRVVRVTNPVRKKSSPLSVVLTIDVSGSMTGSNMEIAKSAANTFIRLMNYETSECALTTFDDLNYLNSDFSTSPAALQGMVNDLKAGGGTDYNAALSTPFTGALDIARTGRNKTVIVFLTDGLGDADAAKIIDRARIEKIVVYCVTVGMPAPTVLKSLATESGGKYFENVVTPAEAARIYHSIFQHASELEPGTIEWMSGPQCERLRAIMFEAPSLKMKVDEVKYWVPQRGVLKVATDKYSVRFPPTINGQSRDTVITLSARNGDFTILSANSSNASFSVRNTFPILIREGAESKINLRHTGAGSYQSTSIDLKASPCPSVVIHASADVPEGTLLPVKVKKPNGGEVYYAGTDTVVTWGNVLPSDKISLEFSSDRGKTWNAIGSDVYGLSKRWKVPAVQSDQMLVRARHGRTPLDTGVLFSKPIMQHMGNVRLSPDGETILSRHNDPNILVIDFRTGELRGKIPSGDKYFSGPRGIYVYRPGSPTKVFDPITMQELSSVPPLQISGSEVFNRDNSQYARHSGSRVEVINVETGEIVRTITVSPGQKLLRFSAGLVVTGGEKGGSVEVLSTRDNSLLARFQLNENFIAIAEISQDEKYLAVWAMNYNASTNTSDGNVHVFDLSAKVKLYTFENAGKGFRNLEVGSELMLCAVNDRATIVTLSTGEVVRTFPAGKAWVNGSITRDDSKVVFGHYDPYSLVAYGLGRSGKTSGVSEDISDLPFSIVIPRIRTKPVNFGNVDVGSQKDSVIAALITNPEKYPVRVRDVRISGEDAGAFSVVSGMAPFSLGPERSRSLEFRFRPNSPKNYKASVQILMDHDTVSLSIEGTGVAKGYAISTQLLNFGDVMVGTSKDTLAGLITNTGSVPLRIRRVSVAGPDLSQFSVSQAAFVVAPGQSQQLQVFFKPSKTGRTSSTLKFILEGMSRPVTLPLFGNGIPKTEQAFVVVFGVVKNKKTQQPVRAEMIRKIGSDQDFRFETAENGAYRIQIPFGVSLELTAHQRDFLSQHVTHDLTALNSYKEIRQDFELEPLEVGSTISLKHVLFERGKPVLIESSYKELDELVSLMADNPTMTIELSGHTDNVGNAEDLLKLSNDRVDVILHYLAKKGVSRKRMTGKGYGSTRPVASNAQEETRRLNRRVEFTIISR